ncbi:MAG: lytic transglycosylase domain-containing protein [Caulobacteraceae bacterium]
MTLVSAGLVAAQPLGQPLDDLPASGAAPVQAVPYYQVQPTQALEDILRASERGDGGTIRAEMANLTDPIERDIALWALVHAAPADLSFAEADLARRSLARWPREAERERAAENLLDQSGFSPQEVIAWFAGRQPQTGRGALALSSALESTGQTVAAADLVRTAWRTMPFGIEEQEAILAKFGGVLTSADDIAREDLLLYGEQGPAAEDMLRLLPADQQALAEARMAIRKGASDWQSLVAALPINLQSSPGLVFEEAVRDRQEDQIGSALALAQYLPTDNPDQKAAARFWKHGDLVSDALQLGNFQAAYQIAAHSGLTSGPEAAGAEFTAGWIALTRLNNPKLADAHFARLQVLGRTPITLGRAYYWRGRAAQAMGDPVGAQYYFGLGARYITTFYGQLSAAEAGITRISLPHDPVITQADRDAFNAQSAVSAARMIADIGDKKVFCAFVAELADTMTDPVQEAQLVDMARAYGDASSAMRVVRNAAEHDVVLADRGYPLAVPPIVGGAPETPFILGVVRQESSFNPQARSGAGARGMMQLMPATAAIEARRIGVSYSPDELSDPSYNMELGSAFLGQLVGDFSGSYVMAAAAYNAGPGRPASWATVCGDPRSPNVDPVNFIECIPFHETRNYVMRVIEATEVYRARLNGGSAPLEITQDLRRGAYTLLPVTPSAPSPITTSLATQVSQPSS